jgi:hypothetical protein
MMNYFFEKMKKIFMILFAGLLVPAGLSAQKVYLDGTKVILDLTKEAGMPAGAITATPKTWLDAPVNSNRVPIRNNTENGEINRTVFQKLEIAASDHPVGKTDWAMAFNTCKGLGDGWRLPTQREVMLIWIFREALEDIFNYLDPKGSNFLDDYYWSATEYSTVSSWNITFAYGSTNQIYSTKVDPCAVRCVREVN